MLALARATSSEPLRGQSGRCRRAGNYLDDPFACSWLEECLHQNGSDLQAGQISKPASWLLELLQKSRIALATDSWSNPCRTVNGASKSHRLSADSCARVGLLGKEGVLILEDEIADFCRRIVLQAAWPHDGEVET